MEVTLKSIIAALAGASLLAIAMPAAAQHAGGGGHGGSSGGGMHSGGFSHGGVAGRPGFEGGHFHGGFSHEGFAGRPGFDGDRFHRGFHRGFGGDPFAFAGLGLGFALGLNAYDPWYYDGPYYGYYPDYPPPPAYSYAPPPANAAPPPAACGSWSWDAARQAYNWVPC
jgi:hypothetical protein